jgi:hypothetical protein
MCTVHNSGERNTSLTFIFLPLGLIYCRALRRNEGTVKKTANSYTRCPPEHNVDWVALHLFQFSFTHVHYCLEVNTDIIKVAYKGKHLNRVGNYNMYLIRKVISS